MRRPAASAARVSPMPYVTISSTPSRSAVARWIASAERSGACVPAASRSPRVTSTRMIVSSTAVMADAPISAGFRPAAQCGSACSRRTREEDAPERPPKTHCVEPCRRAVEDGHGDTGIVHGPMLCLSPSWWVDCGGVGPPLARPRTASVVIGRGRWCVLFSASADRLGPGDPDPAAGSRPAPHVCCASDVATRPAQTRRPAPRAHSARPRTACGRAGDGASAKVGGASGSGVTP